MSERRGHRPPRPTGRLNVSIRRLLAGVTVTALLAGCTTTNGAGGDGAAGGPADDAAVTTTVITSAEGPGPAAAPTGQQANVELPDPPPAAGGGITVVAPPHASSDAPSPVVTPPTAAPAAPTAPARPATTTSAPKTSAPKPPAPKPPAPPKATITVNPANGAAKVSPLHPIKVSAAGGLLENVNVINPEGKIVYHQYRIRHSSWSVAPELGFDRKYRVVVDSRNKAGTPQRDEFSFTTVPAGARLTASIFPSGNQKVGVGQPIQITFNHRIQGAKTKALVQKLITVKTSTGQGGKFRWFSDTELRWRPMTYFKPKTKVDVTVKIYGRHIAGRLYGGQDASARFVAARSMISTVDAVTHQMVVKVNGKAVKKFPVSLGNDKYPTYNGVHVVTERLPTHLMDSSTWGLTGAGAYRTNVKWATRISNSGEFVHGAPWSAYAQGNSNVSHGCINMSDAAARWFMLYSLPGDLVIVKNSKGPKLKSWDGFGDWNLPWGKY